MVVESNYIHRQTSVVPHSVGEKEAVELDLEPPLDSEDLACHFQALRMEIQNRQMEETDRAKPDSFLRHLREKLDRASSPFVGVEIGAARTQCGFDGSEMKALHCSMEGFVRTASAPPVS